jgi:transcription-repair coupling factor (superfamily II helicase)
MSKLFTIPSLKTKEQRYGQLYGCSLPLLISEYANSTSCVKLIVVPDNLKAHILYSELNFFKSQSDFSEILIFPDLETLPYDQFSPHQDIISNRLSVLSKINTAQNMLIITAASTLMQRVCPVGYINNNSLVLQCGQCLNGEEFRYSFQKAGY